VEEALDPYYIYFRQKRILEETETRNPLRAFEGTPNRLGDKHMTASYGHDAADVAMHNQHDTPVHPITQDIRVQHIEEKQD
jgi:hypothetical protein